MKLKVNDIVTVKNKCHTDPRMKGKVLRLYEDNTTVSVWWEYGDHENDVPPGIMIQTEKIADIELADKTV